MFLEFKLVFIFFIATTTVMADAVQYPDLLSIYHSINNRDVDLLQGQKIHIKSDVSDERLKADIYAIQQYPFPDLIEKLSEPAQWCQFVTLHLNIKACTYQKNGADFVSFYAGRKFYEDAENAFELKYQFLVKEKNERYFKLNLSADSGPFSTSNYLIEVEVLKFDTEVLIHFSLAYDTSFSSRLGTGVYLSTIGSDKVGFSQQLNEENKKEFIKGVNGIIERNVMRYFLALSSYLKYHSDQSKMMQDWFSSTEEYSQQLHEVERAEYLDAKKKEYEQQAVMQKRLSDGKPVFNLSTDEK